MLQGMRLPAELGPTKTKFLPAEMRGALAAKVYVEPRPKVALVKLAWWPAAVNKSRALN